MASFKVLKKKAGYGTTNGTTVLLLNGNGSNNENNNTFLDSSSNYFTVTRGGSVTQGSVSPFSTYGYPYDPSVHGGSGYFNTTDYLSLPNNSAFNLGNTYTIECWIKITEGTAGTIFMMAPTTVLFFKYLAFGITGTNKVILSCRQNTGDPDSSIVYITSTSSIIINQWTHIACCVNSGTATIFINGNFDTSGTIHAYNFGTNTTHITIGKNTNGWTNSSFKGYLSDLRIIKGRALYESNFSVPTAPLASTGTETSLLLNFTNGNVIDGARNSNVVTAGNASISTAVTKFGSGSLAFDGTNDWLYVPGGSQFAYGTGNFTIEFWCNFTRVTVPGDTWNPRILSQGTNNSTRLQIYIEDTASGSRGPIGELVLYTNTTISKTNMAVNDGNWHHIAFVRQEGTIRTFVDGNLKDARVDSTNFDDIAGYTIGAYNNSASGEYLGYLDDFRIIKGDALYTSNFTPPTQELKTVQYIY